MGLDMYLRKKIYVGNKYRDNEERIKIKVPKKQKSAMIKIEGIKEERVSSIEEEIGYWRKTNSIHQWFVDNVQDGNDDCKSYYVSKDKLKELLCLVKRVLENHKLAEKLLPNQEGFFFGSTEYDGYYFKDLEETKKIISNAIEDARLGEIYYDSSW